MRSIFLGFVFVMGVGFSGHAQQKSYLFSYFKGNGEDGLHLAYSTDGYHWEALNNDHSFLNPAAGKDKLMRDPSIVQGPDGTFHMVWTVSWHERGIGHASSKDLITWSEQQYLPVMEYEKDADNCWAPELFYDARKKQYIIFWATHIPGRFTTGADQKYNHRLYCTTTKDFKTFTPTQLFYNYDFSVIDAAIVKAGKQYVMFLKDETDKPYKPEKNIHIATSKQATGPYSKPGPAITGNYWAEGPAPIKIGNTWFVYFDKYTQHKYGVITSTDLVHWTDESDKLKMPDGIRHGTAFEVPAAIAKRVKEVKIINTVY